METLESTEECVCCAYLFIFTLELSVFWLFPLKIKTIWKWHRFSFSCRRIIWFGDLNYRLDLSYEKARVLISEKKWSKMVERDQVVKLAQRLLGSLKNLWLWIYFCQYIQSLPSPKSPYRNKVGKYTVAVLKFALKS